MTPKLFLISMTVVAVISDSLLHPFYPQYFATVLRIEDPRHVGLYIAACSLVVVMSFPVWALVSRRIRVLPLLVGTQALAGLLGLACSASDSVPEFWLLSLSMMAFKASYLLIYPYVMSLEAKDQHIGTISLLAFVVHFANIFAALLSGLVFQLVNPRFLFVVMAGGDVLQLLLCVYALRARTLRVEPEPLPALVATEAIAPRFILKLGVVMSLLYLSAYLSEPFFSAYWERVALSENKITTGMVFAIPGVSALLALVVNTRRAANLGLAGVVPSALLGAAGLCLQAIGHSATVVVGRFLFGWALFQAMVRLDLLLFRFSTKESYALDFSKANLFQGVGVLLASSTVGGLVSAFGVKAPFIGAAVGFLVVAVAYQALLRSERQCELSTGSPEAANVEGATT